MKPIAKVDVLRWNVDLMALYKGIEIPGHIDVNELLIDTSNIDDYVGIMNAESVLSNIGVSGLLALQSLSINRTQLIGQQSLDLAPIELKRNKQKISLSMRDQSIFSTSQVPKLGSMVNINTSIDVAKAREERVAVIPFSLQNEDFNLSAQVKIFNQQDQVYLEFESYIDQIEVSKINQNIPESLSASEGARWIDEVLKDGFLTDIMLTTRFNMSGEIEAPNTKFSANLSKATINANPNWPSIEDINAKVTFSNDYLKIVGNQARVEGIDLSYLSITTRDFNQPDAKLSLNARFDSNSQKVEQFIRETSVSDKIKAYLNEFELIGKLWGNINLVAPLQKNTDQKPELTFDMFASENSLSLFDGEINVDGFNSQISFKDGLIRTKGKGLIGGELFQMSLNPKDWINEDNSALKVKLTHLSSSIDAFISKRSSVEWSSIMKSEDLYADLTLLIDNDGKYILNLKDLNISSLDNINDWKLSPKIFPSLHLSLKDSKVNNKIVPNFEADLINHDYVMEIKNLVFENIGLSEEDLVFNGSWLKRKNSSKS